MLLSEALGKICLQVGDENELLYFDKRSQEWKSFMFDRCWRPRDRQEDVFLDIEPLVMTVVDGFNASIIAYGQTGSGKTYTMDGTTTERGISYRTLQKLFELLEYKQSMHKMHHRCTDETTGINRRGNEKVAEELNHAAELNSDGEIGMTFTITVSIMEIYNEHVNDLLTLPPLGECERTTKPSLDVRISPDGKVFVEGLCKHTVTSVDEVFAIFEKGNANRATASTNSNEASSRSHTILTVDVTLSGGDYHIPVTGSLFLIDLAGSERVGKSGVSGSSLRETQYINKSLSGNFLLIYL